MSLPDLETELPESASIGAEDVGDITRLMIRLEKQCDGGAEQTALSEGVATLLQVVPDRADAVLLVRAAQRVRWPQQWGPVPYRRAAEALQAAVDGTALPPGANAGQRALHTLLLDAYALPAARARLNLDAQSMRQRYPRLLRAMRHAALLTTGEAEATLRVLLRTHPVARDRCAPSCEATAHFGGNLKVVRRARVVRQRFPSARMLTPQVSGAAQA